MNDAMERRIDAFVEVEGGWKEVFKESAGLPESPVGNCRKSVMVACDLSIVGPNCRNGGVCAGHQP